MRMLVLAGFQVQKVSDAIPYMGCVRFYELTDEGMEDHDWIYDKGSEGVYKVEGVEQEFFIQRGEIRFDGSLDSHPVVDRLKERYGVVKHDDFEEGPFGGAFASERDYWSYREGSVFAREVFGY